MRVRILGSGTSSGVPRIGGADGAGDWGECDPAEPRNRRTRASILVEHEGTTILVDTGPDMREQLLAARVGCVDAVIWTHDHADHTHGLDDLRQLFHARGGPVPCYARPETAAVLRRRFDYVFEGRGGYPATATLMPLGDRLTVGGITVSVVDQPHGRITSAGLRFEAGGRAVGYATDASAMTPALHAHYSGLDAWIVDALRRRPHPSHLELGAALHWAAELRPTRTVLIHMDQSMDYRTLAAELPPGVEPGYDGLEIAP